MLAKAKERGYEITMVSGDKDWYALYSNRHRLNLQLRIFKGEFKLSHMVSSSIVEITTNWCGSFMSDEHFDKLERQIRKVVFNQLGED